MFHSPAAPDQADINKNTTLFLSQPWPSSLKAYKPQRSYDSASTYPFNYKQTMHTTTHGGDKIKLCIKTAISLKQRISNICADTNTPLPRCIEILDAKMFKNLGLPWHTASSRAEWFFNMLGWCLLWLIARCVVRKVVWLYGGLSSSLRFWSGVYRNALSKMLKIICVGLMCESAITTTDRRRGGPPHPSIAWPL